MKYVCTWPLRWLFGGGVFLVAPLLVSGQWQSLGGGVNHLVHAFLVDEEADELIVSGSFIQTNTDSLLLRGLGRWNGQEWNTLAGGSGDTINGSMNAVWALAEHHDTLFIAHGNIIWHYDPDLLGAAYLTDSTWHACGSPTNNFFVFEENGRLFGGGADSLQGSYMPGVVEWVGGQWTTPPGSPFVNIADVYGSAYWHGQYYFGGVFLVEGSRKIVAYDGVDQWSGLGGGVGGVHINAIEGYGDSLYVGGFFTPGQDVQSQHIQIWDGVGWKPFFPEVEYYDQVWDLVVYDGSLYISGAFKFIDSDTDYSILRYNGHEICAIGGSFIGTGTSRRLAFFNGDLYSSLPVGFPFLPGEQVGRLPLNDLIPDRCVTVSTGFAESRSETTFKVHPNPVSQEFTLQFGELQADQVVILDATGRMVRQLPVEGHSSLTVPASGFAPGSYAVRVSDGSGVRTAWFIKD